MTEEKKTTLMKIEVDLQCHRCRKKIKKVLCKFHQIQDQVYNEKENYVVIKVVCCCPERIKKKIKCKGGHTIKRIEEFKVPETKPPEKKPPDQKPKPAEPEEKKKPQQKKDPEPVCVPVPPCGCGTCCTKCCGRRGRGPCLCGHGTKPCPPLTPRPHAKPVPEPVGSGTCCTECNEGRDGGPCHYGRGRPPPCYDGYSYGRPIYDSYGGGYRCEETSSGCPIM